MLEFCDEGYLEDFIQKKGGKLSEKLAKIILFQILKGLLAIH
jgi:serine/threonine protein kinase